MPLNISAESLLAWNDVTAKRWREFIVANPAILALPSDIWNGKTVADTLQHIVGAELRYAQRLAGVPQSPYEEIPKDSIDPILAAHTLAFDLIGGLLANANYDWSAKITFETISAGRLRATRETVLLHLTLHSIRHYAQLATMVRQRGFKPDWPMDYLSMAAERA